MKTATNYPEIANGTLKDTRGALSLGYLNYDGLTPAGQAELLPRLIAMHNRLAELGSPVAVPASMKEALLAAAARVYWTNHGYFSAEMFPSLAEAFAYGKSKCFEFTIHQAGEVHASWSPIAGTRAYTPAGQALYR